MTFTGTPLRTDDPKIVLFPFLDKEGRRLLNGDKKALERYNLRTGFINVHEISNGQYTTIHTNMPLRSRKKANKEVKQLAAFYVSKGLQYRCRYRIRVKWK